MTSPSTSAASRTPQSSATDRFSRSRWWIACAPIVLAAMHCGGSADDGTAGVGGKSPGGSGGASADAGGSGGSGGTAGSGLTGGSGGGAAGMAGSGASSGSGGAPPSNAEPALYVVHASPDLHDFRVCVTADGVVLDEMPMPYDPAYPVPYTNYTGVPVGGVVDLTSLLPVLQSKSEFELHLINAANPKVAGIYEGAIDEVSCTNLLCSSSATCLDADEHLQFGPFALGTLSAEPVQVFVVEGCLTGTGLPVTLDENKCGPSFNTSSPASNVDIRPVRFFPAFNTSDLGVTVYAAHVAPTLGSTYAGSTLRLSFGPLNNPGGLTPLVENLGDTPTASLLSPVPMPADEPEYLATGLVLDSVDTNNDVQTVLRASLADVIAQQDPDALAADFYSSASGYLFLVVGDATSEPAPWLTEPNSTNPEYDGRGLHIVALRLRESAE